MEIQNSKMMLEESKKALSNVDMMDYICSFPNSYLTTLKQLGIKDYKDLPEDAEAHGNFWQLFWENLPDERYIRGPQFNLICDLAEWYCFGGR